jgi:hypothetical protein
MKDVTSSVVAFREAVRHLWNAALAPNANWETRDAFSRVCGEVFAVLVLRPLGLVRERLPNLYEAEPEPIGSLVVVPTVARGVPVHINRAAPRTPYWDHSVNCLAPNDAELELIRLFDWNELGQRDFEFLETRIAAFGAHPELVGRAALIPFGYAKILFREAAGEAPGT